MASRIHIQYNLLALQGTVYNLCIGLFANMHDQLTRCRIRWKKQFCYGFILVYFFFELVPTTCPYVFMSPGSSRDLEVKVDGVFIMPGGW